MTMATMQENNRLHVAPEANATDSNPTLETKAIDSGYSPEEDGSVIGKRGFALTPFRPNGLYMYQAIKFWDSVTKRYHTVYLHRLVWTKYRGPIPEGALVFHRDNDPTNNQLPNLALSEVTGMITLASGEQMTVDDYNTNYTA